MTTDIKILTGKNPAPVGAKTSNYTTYAIKLNKYQVGI